MVQQEITFHFIDNWSMEEARAILYLTLQTVPDRLDKVKRLIQVQMGTLSGLLQSQKDGVLSPERLQSYRNEAMTEVFRLLKSDTDIDPDRIVATYIESRFDWRCRVAPTFCAEVRWYSDFQLSDLLVLIGLMEARLPTEEFKGRTELQLYREKVTTFMTRISLEAVPFNEVVLQRNQLGWSITEFHRLYHQFLPSLDSMVTIARR